MGGAKGWWWWKWIRCKRSQPNRRGRLARKDRPAKRRRGPARRRSGAVKAAEIRPGGRVVIATPVSMI